MSDTDAKTWDGPGWTVLATPGRTIDLRSNGGSLGINDQDASILCETLLACAEDDQLRSFESCMMAHEASPSPEMQEFLGQQDGFNIFVWGEGSFVHIDAQYTFINLSIHKDEAHSVAVALLEANDHWSMGPCPDCGYSMAEHPCNCCPEPGDYCL